MSDLIERQDVINAFRKAFYDLLDDADIITDRDKLLLTANKVITSSVRELPSAQLEQRWIPCSERLPEDGQNVLVTYKTTGKIHPCQYHADGSRNPWYSYIDQCRAYMNVVLAWMPLPEPYRAERRTDED